MASQSISMRARTICSTTATNTVRRPSAAICQFYNRTILTSSSASLDRTTNCRYNISNNSTDTLTTRRNYSSFLRVCKKNHPKPSSNYKNVPFKTTRWFSSDAKEDFYKTLGVPKGSDKGTIKKAYFKLAKEHHPDTNQGDAKAAEQFKKVTEAYEVLSDDKQRELYDTYGHAGVDPNSGFGGGGGGNPFGQGGNPFGEGNPFGQGFSDGSFHFSSSGPGGQQIDPEDLFDAFFGGGRRQRGPRRGSDLQMQMNLSFHDAVFGTKEDLKVRYQVINPATGNVEVKSREVEVTVPAGIDSGMNLRLSGQGAEGDPGAPKGNLIVTVIVEDDKEGFFHRDGADVHVEVPISVTQAILGGTVDVKTLGGKEVEMKIPKGCQPESKLVIRGKGIQYLNGRGKGNQIVHLKIKVPKKLTARQEELLREFDEEEQKSGTGISGRLAQAAGSAFDSFFGGSKKSKEKGKGDIEEEEDIEEKQQKAQ